MTLSDMQKLAYQNKLDKGFNVTDVSMEFCLLHGELAEAYESFSRQRGNVGEELADVAIYLMGLSQMLDVDLEAEIAKKIARNESRKYQKDGKTIRYTEVK
ncbi:hypothetical protein FWC63_01165 [Candidatus Saccharibacteria bacterium]|nr:hypothetical protein [Candidatus Saccharibacteria bacterium]